MNKIGTCILLLISAIGVKANSGDSLLLAKNSFTITTFEDAKFKDVLQPKLQNSQFVLVGEQHGIAEVGEFTNHIFKACSELGYKNLCIETDPIVASNIETFAKEPNPVDKAKALDKQLPLSVPFYNNSNDYQMFQAVVKAGGKLWGIDQALMTQFRLNFSHLIEHTDDKSFKSRLTEELTKAEAAFEKTMTTKDFGAPYIFKYDEQTHKELLELAPTKEERRVIELLWETRTIYSYNFSGQYYLNNSTRCELMKKQFMDYYKSAQQTEALPKVVFKMGANHAGRGLNSTNVYDVGNLASEIANSNGMRSVHITVRGIRGTQAVGNPFAPNPYQEFDNADSYPQEIQALIESVSEGYLVVNLEELKGQARKFSAEMQTFIFRYDVLILVADAKANKKL